MSALHGIGGKQRAGVFNPLLLLIMGFRSVHAAGGLGRIAADVGHFLQDHEIPARLLRHDRGRHAGTAGADDHDLRVHRFVFLNFFRTITLIPAVGVQHGDVCAGFGQRGRRGLDDRIAGDCRAGQRVHIGGLGGHDGFCQLPGRGAAQLRGLPGSVNQHVCDFFLVHRDLNLDLRKQALLGSLVGPGREQTRFRLGFRESSCNPGSHHQRKQQTDEFFHGGSSLSFRGCGPCIRF